LLKTYPQFSSLSIDEPDGFSWFHSLQTSVEKRMSAGLTFQAAWTYSKFMQAITYKNDTDLRPERVVSENDYPHRIAVSAIYELPFGRGRGGVSRARVFWKWIADGWQLRGYYEGQSGQALGFGNAIFRGRLADIPLPVNRRKPERWFNVDAGFERDIQKALAYNIIGISTRFNNVRSDGINNFNMALSKSIRLRERYVIEYQFETFNTLNHAQFGNPNTTPTSSAFGTVTAINGHGAREINMALKISF